MKTPKLGVIIPAAGASIRFSSSQRKVLYHLQNQPLIVHAAFPFFNILELSVLVIVVPIGEKSLFSKIIKTAFPGKCWEVVEGGETRALSVYNGFKIIKDEIDIVMIHDGARPMISSQLIERVYNKVKEKGSAVPVLKIKDNIAVSNGNDSLAFPMNRDLLRVVQTPQGFRVDILGRAYEMIDCWYNYPDEGSLVGKAGFRVFEVPGEQINLKITTIEDIEYVEYVLRRRKL